MLPLKAPDHRDRADGLKASQRDHDPFAVLLGHAGRAASLAIVVEPEEHANQAALRRPGSERVRNLAESTRTEPLDRHGVAISLSEVLRGCRRIATADQLYLHHSALWLDPDGDDLKAGLPERRLIGGDAIVDSLQLVHRSRHGLERHPLAPDPTQLGLMHARVADEPDEQRTPSIAPTEPGAPVDLGVATQYSSTAQQRSSGTSSSHSSAV